MSLISHFAGRALLMGMGLTCWSMTTAEAAQTPGRIETCGVHAAGDDAEPLGTRALGEACSKDCQCESKECKGFRCVVRNLKEHPILPAGSQCLFDGDCASCDCAGGRCR